MKFSKAHKDFLFWLQDIKDKSEKTLEQYDRHLRRFQDFLIKNKLGDIEIEEITLQLTKDYREFLHNESKRYLSVKTRNAYMITLRSFLKFLEKEWHKSLSATSIDLIKQAPRQVEFLTQDEVDRLLDAPDKTQITGVRDLAIMECIYSTWLRISELVALNRNDINLERKEFAVRWKWKKVRVVYLSDNAVKKIKDYLTARTDNFSPLFIRHNYNKENINELSWDDLRISRNFVTTLIKNYWIKACILKSISAHTLRHSFATTLLNNWADIRAIQELLWHTSINTTQVYTHVTNPKLKDIHNKYFK